jgi:short-subunit dehydrogenase
MSASVVLTGATGGIGEAIARGLVARGARLILVARSAEPVARLARELEGQAGRRGGVTALAVDVTHPEGRAAVVACAAAARCDTLINNAAIPSFGELETLDGAHLDAVIATDLLAPMQLTRAMLPVLGARDRATVLNVGSALGRIGLPGFSVYGAAKFGLRGFSEALRRELADGPIRVRHLAPRTTRTAFNDARVDAYNRATGTRSDPPERVARAALAMLDGGPGERFIGFPEWLAVRLNGLAPLLLDGAFKSHRTAVRAARPRAAARPEPTPLEVTE